MKELNEAQSKKELFELIKSKVDFSEDLIEKHNLVGQEEDEICIEIPKEIENSNVEPINNLSSILEKELDSKSYRKTFRIGDRKKDWGRKAFVIKVPT